MLEISKRVVFSMLLLCSALVQAGPIGSSGGGLRPPMQPGQQQPVGDHGQAGKTEGEDQATRTENKAVAQARDLKQKAQASKQAGKKIHPTLTATEIRKLNSISRLARRAATNKTARAQLERQWTALVTSRASRKPSLDIDALVQAAMTDAWRDEARALHREMYSLHRANTLKKKLNSEITRARAHRKQMANLPEDKQVYRPARINGVQTRAITDPADMDRHIQRLESRHKTVGDDTQALMLQLQQKLQKQQQVIQTLSSLMKAMHDTATSIVRKIG
jgi:hypothetical protein